MIVPGLKVADKLRFVVHSQAAGTRIIYDMIAQQDGQMYVRCVSPWRRPVWLVHWALASYRRTSRPFVPRNV
jgi:hypothetical protein